MNVYSQPPISIPDPFFEDELIFLGIDTNPIRNGSITYSDAVVVTSLSLGFSNIADFTGIQGFTNLTFLDVSDIGFNTLDLTGLVNLNTLYCADNNMSSLILTGCVNLTYVSCYDNALTNLDFSAFPNLQYLDCSRNGLTSLNVVGLSNLFEFYCFENQLTTLNLTGLTDLSKFNCATNLLYCLDITNKRNLILLRCQENPNLTCIQVDDVGFASSNASFIEDTIATYNLSCPACPTTNPCTTLITPTFSPYNQYCSGDTTVPPLPTTSNNQNGITGTWSPAYNNLVTTTYTFTPDAGQCATTTTLTINFVPSFTNTTTLTACDSYTWAANGNTYTSSGTYTYVDGCDTEILELTIVPTITSQFINVSTGIDNAGNALAAGTVDPNWQIASSPNPPGTPALVSNYFAPFWEVTPVASTNAGWINHYGAPRFLVSQIGIYTFERPFTVGVGTTTIDYNLTVAYDDALVSFEFVRPDLTTSPINVTIGSNGARFLSVSTPNSVFPSTQDGVWKIRAVVNFIDEGAGFLLSGTITVNTNASTVPTFTQVGPICSGTTLAPLPTSSTNPTAITGTWSPAVNNLATTTYTFTPDAGQCATTTTMTIVVNPIVTPTFNPIPNVCTLTTASPLQTTSTNLIPGTWSPAFNNATTPFNLTTTVYTFTPAAGQCATTTTKSVTVYPVQDILFIPIEPICSGATLIPPPNTSQNGIPGIWSPAFSNTTTTTSTFTPNSGYCAVPRTLTITVNPILTPTFTQVPVLCSTTSISPLPITSNNGITGTWSPVFDLLATTTYTFTPNAGQCVSNTIVTMTIRTITATRWYQDLDGDGYGNPSVRIVSCSQPTGYILDRTDCNDSNANVNPNHVEVPGNGIDDNCSGTIDEVTPTVQVIPSQCGITLTSLWDTIFATTAAGVPTNYRFEISVGGFVRTFDTAPAVQLNKCTMYNFPCVAFNTTYSVRVARKVNGFWQAYGPPCNITTPAGIITSLIASACGSTVSSRWATIFINPVGNTFCYTVTAYRVKVIDGSGRISFLELPAPGPTGFNLSSAFVPAIIRAPNATYAVSIQIQLNGVWQTFGGQDLYGPTCTITTSPTFSTQAEAAADATDFKVVAYPNPYSDDFNLDINTASEESLEIKIYDMMGRLIATNQAKEADLHELRFGEHYASGVYNVIITQGENVKTLRVIKR